MSNEDPEWDAFLRALGDLVVQSNYLEDAMVDLYRITSGEQQSVALTKIRGKTLGPLWEMVLQACRAAMNDPKILERVDVVEPIVNSAVELRNAFVHASWVFHSARGELQRTRTPRGAKHDPAFQEVLRFKPSAVDTATEQIVTACELLYDLYDDARPTLPAGPGWCGAIDQNGIYTPHDQ